MSNPQSDAQLRRCLENAITAIQGTIRRLEGREEKEEKQSSPSPGRNSFRSRIATDTNINTFTLNKEENELMDELKNKN